MTSTSTFKIVDDVTALESIKEGSCAKYSKLWREYKDYVHQFGTSIDWDLLPMIWLVNAALDIILFLIRRLTKLLLHQILQYTLTLHTIHLHHTGLNENGEHDFLFLYQ